MARSRRDLRLKPISKAQLFREMVEACRWAGIGECVVVFSADVTEEHEQNPRRYAQMYLREDGVPVFEFAEQTRELPYTHRLGLYAHEIGHALRLPNDHTEDDADSAGMEALGVLICYDPRWPGKGLQVAVW